MSDVYELKLYDSTLISFEYKKNALGGHDVSIIDVNESEPKELFPVGYEISDKGILKWLNDRVIPKNRAFVNEILKAQGLTLGDVKGIIDVCKGLSLNDSYWVIPINSDLKYSDYNLYENKFSEVLSLVAYTGLQQAEGSGGSSPEFTTTGALPKGWRYLDDDGIYLYKGGTTGSANSGREPVTEFLASQVALAMDIDHVNYDIEYWKEMLASKCKLFTTINTSFVPVYNYVGNAGLESAVSFYDTEGGLYYDFVRDMLVFDALIYNEDRHFGNFGMLRDNKTGKIKQNAPIFDNGNSLFFRAMPDDFNDLQSYAKTRYPYYHNATFEGICNTYITDRQVEKLRRLKDFTFNKHPIIEIPCGYITAIDSLIRKRSVELIELCRK